MSRRTRAGETGSRCWSRTVRAMHWFQPLAWLALRELRRECELAADEDVIAGYARLQLRRAVASDRACPERACRGDRDGSAAVRARAPKVALDGDLITPEQHFDCGNGARAYGSDVLRNAASYGSLDAAEILAVSSNIGVSLRRRAPRRAAEGCAGRDVLRDHRQKKRAASRVWHTGSMFDWWRRLDRAQLLAEPFPEAFRTLIEARVPLWQYLTEPERSKLEALVRVFISEKNFEGAGGLELTDEVRVVIAARACLLLLHRVELDSPLYPELASIVVYPSTYRSHERQRDGYLVVEGEEARLGESWLRGLVVLAWDSVLAGGASPADGHDVVLHEFAHQLDAEDGVMDGTPELDDSERYSAWSRVAGQEYAELGAAVERHKKTDIDPYGASNGPEFFAVVVEEFFEQSQKLERQHAELYRELAAFFRFDPAARLREVGRS